MEIAPSDALSVLRSHLESLVALARVASPNPPPTRILAREKALEWQVSPVLDPAREPTWRVRSYTDPADHGAVFVIPAHLWEDQDLSALTPAAARELAMALLAAADHAESSPQRFPLTSDHD